jgi:hypothetical protein
MQVSSERGLTRRRPLARPWRHANFCLSVLFLLLVITAACSGTNSPEPLPVLHHRGVAQVPGFDRFLQTVDAYPKDRLQALTAYQPGGESKTAHAFLVIGDGLYDLSLDGSSSRLVPMPGACQDRPAVTDDGRWLLCADAQGVIALDLQASGPNNWRMALLNAKSDSLPEGDRPRLAAWGPDNRHFVVGLYAPDSCVLGVYLADPPYGQAQLVVKLAFPQLATPTVTTTPYEHTCEIQDVGWSPDGRWLAFIAGRPLESGAISHLYALDLRTYPLPQDTASQSATAVTVPANAIKDLGGAGNNLTWSSSSLTITMAGYGAIINVNLLTQERQTVLAQPGVQFCTASWTPDGTTLVFILCRPGNIEVVGPRAQLYVYTLGGP